MICIARNYDGYIIDIVLARSLELANIYWQGKGVYPHRTDIREEYQLENHPTGVIPILSTYEQEYEDKYTYRRKLCIAVKGR